MKSCAVEVGGALAADEHCAHLVEEAIPVEEEAGAARVWNSWQRKVGGHVTVPTQCKKSILSPGQGWHRRANAQKSYKSPPNGQPIN